MAGEQKRPFRLPALSGSALWVAITALVVIGLITTVIDLWQLPTKEAARANETAQRFVVNTLTGVVNLGKAGSADTTPLDPNPADAVPITPQPNTEKADVAEPHESAEPVTEEVVAEPQEEALPEGTPTLRTEPISADLTAPAHTEDSLVSAPAPEVTETINGMQLPKRGDNDITPSKLYAHPFNRTPDQILISFVILDAGLDTQSTGLMLGLPPQVSIAYSPYSRKDTNYSEHLRAVGHEVWTMLPTMGENYPADDPGPLGLVGRMPAEEIIRRTQEVMAAIQGSVGLILPTDETITLQKDALSPVLGEVAKRGLFLLSTHPKRNLDQITNNQGLAEILRRSDLILDPEPNEAQIRSKLSGIMAAAKEKGEYIVTLSSRPQTIQILSGWLRDTHFEAPMVLAPLSAIYQPKELPEAAASKDEGHGGGHGAPKEKKKEKPPEKKKKPLPQDKYLKPAGAEGGGHGGGEKSGGGHGGGH